MITNRLLATFIALGISTLSFGQIKMYFSGQSGERGDYIYADFMDDDGTRYIVSDAFNLTWPSVCSFSLLKTIPKNDSTAVARYALAIETHDFLPKNAKFVIVCGQDKASSIVTLEQSSYANTSGFETKTSLSLSPFALLGSGLGLTMLLTSNERLAETQAYYGVYEISQQGIEHILNRGIIEMRIPTRSKYVSFVGPYDRRNGFMRWLESALTHVEERSIKSVNAIEE